MESVLKAIIWDMDGTIFDTEKLTMLCWEELCAIHGHEYPYEVLLTCIGKSSHDADEILQNHFGPDFDIIFFRAARNDLFKQKISEQGLPLKKGIIDALKWTTTHGIPNAIASSSNHENIVACLRSTDLEKYFSIIVGGDEVINGKPHPEIFLKTAKELGLNPEECIVFEDSYNGVIAADEAGMHVVMIPDLVLPNDEIRARTDNLLTSGTDIIDLLSRLLKE